jgi:DNA-binding MarR family transcriptional regulator
MRIEDEIQQKKFQNVYQKAHINILFTASWLNQSAMHSLRPYNISWQQFNILRILRGMSPEPATVKLLTERMIDKMSNASRLVEKLKQKGLVERNHCSEDRRRVNIVLTEEGLQLVNAASKSVDEEVSQVWDRLSDEEAQNLNEILDKLRG